jgi:hypothetical protein
MMPAIHLPRWLRECYAFINMSRILFTGCILTDTITAYA